MPRACRVCGSVPCECSPGEASAPAKPAAPEPKGNEPVTGRRWAFCEWTSREGRCNAPTGTLGTNPNELTPVRLCAYHRDRERVSLGEVRLTERQWFDDWCRQFPAGTTYQPFPGIWDKDPELLWSLITGQGLFADLAGKLLGRKASLAKLRHDHPEAVTA